MSPTQGNEHSNPISRIFSKIFHHDDAQKAPQATPRTVTPQPAARPQAQTVAQARPQQAQAAVTSTPTATQRTYTVVAGDSLSKIAQRMYGHADQWNRIFEANRDKIHDPNLIHPGQVLVIPDASTLH